MASGRVPRTAITLQGFGNCVHSKGGVAVGAAARQIIGACRRKTLRLGLASALVRVIDHLPCSPIRSRICISILISVTRESIARSALKACTDHDHSKRQGRREQGGVEILSSRASFSMTWTLLLALLSTGVDRNANTCSSRPSGCRGHPHRVKHPIRRLHRHAESSRSAPDTSLAIPIRARETITSSSLAKRITPKGGSCRTTFVAHDCRARCVYRPRSNSHALTQTTAWPLWVRPLERSRSSSRVPE
jgi:hypothetical protein